MSVRELYQAYLNRQDYYIRGPFTGNDRTRIQQDWENLSPDYQIWINFGLLESVHDLKSLARNARSLLHLKAAITIACRDALSSGWLRTLEQVEVEGGPFPGPWRRFHSRNEVEEFLVEYDVGRANAISRKVLEGRVTALIQLLPSLSQDAYENLIENIAKTHNYAYLLELRFETPSDDSPTAPSNGPKDFKVVPLHHKADDKHPGSPASSTSFKTTTTTPPAPALPTLPPLDNGAELDEETQECCRQYHRNQEAFEKELRDAPVSPEHKERYDSLFDWKPYTDQRGRSKVTPITCENYPRVFAMLKATKGWTMSDSMAKLLRGAIFNRAKAQQWYRRLPAEDPRRKDDSGHENILRVLRDGEALLLKPSS